VGAGVERARGTKGGEGGGVSFGSVWFGSVGVFFSWNKE